MSDTKIKFSEGYNQTNFELVTHRSGNYELPISSAAHYSTNENITIKIFIDKLSNHNYCLIAPYKEQKYFSSKILDCKTNEFFHIKIINKKIRIYPKDENFSFETFERIVKYIDENIVSIKLEEK